jgi:hypothetical protein
VDDRLERNDRLASLSEAHRRGISRFGVRLRTFVDDGLLNPEQAAIVQEHLLRLGERNRNPLNTGNLEDLFSYTLVGTRDPVRAYAQVLADSVKVVPMDPAGALVPGLRNLDSGKIARKVGDLAEYNAGDQMLITHTMVAYGDPEMRVSAAGFVRATHPGHDQAAVDRELARMAVQSQHGPSSTFVLSRMRGLTLELAELYSAAGYGATQISDAQRFYDICARFKPDWLNLFLDGVVPEDDDWLAWRKQYLDARQQLPPELIYQLSSDTVTNFFEGTLESGKWTDAVILFGGVTDAAEIPKALAEIVNQYIAEHIALHDRPSREMTSIIAEALEPWGVGFRKNRAVALPGPPKKFREIQAQFEVAWARKTKRS